MSKRWVLSELPSDFSVTAMPEDMHPIGARLLAVRGLTDPSAWPEFFNPDYDRGIHDPFLFSSMQLAVDRIFKALETGEKITVHGDYDADGVTGSAVIISTLRELERFFRVGAQFIAPGSAGLSTDTINPTDPTGKPIDQTGKPTDPTGIPTEPGAINRAPTSNVESYIPHRDKEGYGLHTLTVDLLKEQGTNLIITVDCGIACVPEIAKAKSFGIDTIVVDHHQFGEVLPDGILIHPRLPGEKYPFPHLAAVGVSYKLACALITEARKRGLEFQEGWEKWLLDFVSIATITDMVPLVGENRVLEVYGLKVMNKTRRPGLQRLIQIAGSELGKISSQDIGFGLGPRINAAGRMDHASLALKLMLSETEEEASKYATELEGLNKERQKVTIEMMEVADKMALVGARFIAPGSTEPVPGSSEPTSIRVFASEHWSPALVGLVAGRYLEREGKPVVAIGKHGKNWIGSGRSFAAYDITEAMKRAGEGILLRCGGHVQACGFAFEDGSLLPKLIENLEADARARLKLEDCVAILPIDAELKLEDLSWPLLDTVNRLEPFGEGNRRPVFMSTSLQVLTSDLMGGTKKHVRCQLGDRMGNAMKFVGFNFSDRFGLFAPGNRIDVAYDIGLNEWNGRKEIQCKLVDVRLSEV